MTRGDEPGPADGTGTDDGDEDPYADYHDVYETRVRFAETDAQGVVFYGEYLTYQDETFAAFLRAAGYPYESLDETGWDLHVVNVDVDYRSFARYPDELVCGMRAATVRNSSVTFGWVCRKRDGTVVASGSVTHVAVDEAGETVRVPDDFRERLRAFQDVPPEPG
jgi:acyl-CoA thioester hydrolase